MEVYKDKIYNQLQNGEVRDRILKEQLQQSEYGSQNVYEFLQLLKQPIEMQNKYYFQSINAEE